jgi:hypothetical protein
MKSSLDALLNAIDVFVGRHAPAPPKTALQVIGGSAVVLGYGSTHATKDLDLVGPSGDDLLQKLHGALGKESDAPVRYGAYVDYVWSAFAHAPRGYEGRSRAVEGAWSNIEVWVLDAHDVIVTKLKRFSPIDRRDITWLCRSSGLLIERAKLQPLFEEAFYWDRDLKEDLQPRLDRVHALLRGESINL